MLPSHCYNKLTITASSLKELDNIRRKLEGIDPSFLRHDINELCFQSVVPLPFYKIRTQHVLEKHRLQNWGCASDSLATTRERHGMSLQYSFVTAEQPPTKFYAALRRIFPNETIDAKYENPDLGKKGDA